MLGVGNIFPSFDLPSCDEDNNLGTTKFNDESDDQRPKMICILFLSKRFYIYMSNRN